jgi:hypothetical protein
VPQLQLTLGSIAGEGLQQKAPQLTVQNGRCKVAHRFTFFLADVHLATVSSLQLELLHCGKRRSRLLAKRIIGVPLDGLPRAWYALAGGDVGENSKKHSGVPAEPPAAGEAAHPLRLTQLQEATQDGPTAGGRTETATTPRTPLGRLRARKRSRRVSLALAASVDPHGCALATAAQAVRADELECKRACVLPSTPSRELSPAQPAVFTPLSSSVGIACGVAGSASSIR